MPPIATTRIAPRSVRATMLRRAVRSRNRKTRIMTDLRPRIEPQDIPPELDRWNWGAFLLNWIWGVGNNTYIALLTFVPFVGIVMPFVLGAKGSRWAWRNGRWDNVEHFERTPAPVGDLGRGYRAWRFAASRWHGRWPSLRFQTFRRLRTRGR